MSVQRYKTTDHMVHADADPKGPLLFGDEAQEYVTFADYAALAAQLAAVTAERDKWKEEADRRTREVELTFNVQAYLRTRAESAEAECDRLRDLAAEYSAKNRNMLEGYALMEARATKAEAQLARVRGLQRYEIDFRPSSVDESPIGEWIKSADLDAVLAGEW